MIIKEYGKSCQDDVNDYPSRLTADIRLRIAPPKFPFGELRMSPERCLKFTPPRTHVSNKDIGEIKSPLDSLFKKENGGGAKG